MPESEQPENNMTGLLLKESFQGQWVGELRHSEFRSLLSVYPEVKKPGITSCSLELMRSMKNTWEMRGSSRVCLGWLHSGMERNMAESRQHLSDSQRPGTL